VLLQRRANLACCGCVRLNNFRIRTNPYHIERAMKLARYTIPGRRNGDYQEYCRRGGSETHRKGALSPAWCRFGSLWNADGCSICNAQDRLLESMRCHVPPFATKCAQLSCKLD
jgi:hypothetical protein